MAKPRRIKDKLLHEAYTPVESDADGRCCINRFQAKLPQTPAVAMPRLPSEDGPVL